MLIVGTPIVVSNEVANMVALDSHISTLMTMSLAMGFVFEILPLLAVCQAGISFGEFHAPLSQI